MKLSNLLITGLIISAIVIGFTSFYTGVMSDYEVVADQTKNFTSLDKTMDIYEKTSEMYNQTNVSFVKDPSIVDYIWGVPSNIMIGFYETGLLIFEVPSVFQAIFNDLFMGSIMPEWLPLLLQGIIFVILIGGVIYFVTGRVF